MAGLTEGLADSQQGKWGGPRTCEDVVRTDPLPCATPIYSISLVVQETAALSSHEMYFTPII